MSQRQIKITRAMHTALDRISVESWGASYAIHVAGPAPRLTDPQPYRESLATHHLLLVAEALRELNATPAQVSAAQLKVQQGSTWTDAVLNAARGMDL